MNEARPPTIRALSLRHRLWIGMTVMMLFCLPFVWLPELIFLDSHTLRWAFLPAGLIAGYFISRWIEDPLAQSLMALNMGIHGFQDGDLSFRLLIPSQPEIADLVQRFNRLGDTLRQERSTIYQKELLLDTVIQNAPMAILLVGTKGRIMLANTEARQMFNLGKPLTGLVFSEFESAMPANLREALQKDQSLFTLESGTDSEVFHLSKSPFHLHGIPHNLILIKRLTREIKRQEVLTWKKLIRLINHELNNALAPLQSLLNSTRKILANTAEYTRIEPLFDTMQSTIEHLIKFLQHYATFARLPNPQCQDHSWEVFLEGVQALMDFELVNELKDGQGYFDSGQLQQVLLNVLKNAREASTGQAPVKMVLQNTPQGGTLIRVLDRGKGMQPEHMQKALLPFYSTKRGGTGLGLALSREILESHGGDIRIEPREGGGLMVTCYLPPKNSTERT